MSERQQPQQQTPTNIHEFSRCSTHTPKAGPTERPCMADVLAAAKRVSKPAPTIAELPLCAQRFA